MPPQVPTPNCMAETANIMYISNPVGTFHLWELFCCWHCTKEGRGGGNAIAPAYLSTQHSIREGRGWEAMQTSLLFNFTFSCCQLQSREQLPCQCRDQFRSYTLQINYLLIQKRWLSTLLTLSPTLYDGLSYEALFLDELI